MYILAVAVTQVTKSASKDLHGNITGSGSVLQDRKR